MGQATRHVRSPERGVLRRPGARAARGRDWAREPAWARRGRSGGGRGAGPSGV